MIVRWREETEHEWILSIDRATNNGIIGGGKIIRNKNKIHRLTYFRFYGTRTRNLGETMTLLEGIIACRELKIWDVQIRTDSKLVVGWIKK